MCSCELKQLNVSYFLFMNYYHTLKYQNASLRMALTTTEQIETMNSLRIHNLYRVLYKYRRAIQLFIYGGKITRLYVHNAFLTIHLFFYFKLSVLSYKIIISLGQKRRGGDQIKGNKMPMMYFYRTFLWNLHYGFYMLIM